MARMHLQVSANGFIYFGVQKLYRIGPPSSGQGWPKDTYIVAPMWADLDLSNNTQGGLFFGDLEQDRNSDSNKYLKKIAGMIPNMTEVFDPRFAIVATWQLARPSPAARHQYEVRC